MNRAELVEHVSKELTVSKAQADKSIKAVLTGIEKSLKKGKRVQLVGFGTFSVKKRKARTGRNPATGATIKIAASKTVGFKPGKALKNSL